MATHDTGAYNVQSTLFAWMREQLIASQPPSLSSTVIHLEMPEGSITPPCYSFHMLTMEDDPGGRWQGGRTGGGTRGAGRFGIFEVDCWASRSAVDRVRQLAQMRDAVTYAIRSQSAQGGVVIIKDFYANASAPANTAYKINLERVEEAGTPPDPNPDIMRKRLLITFSWTERT